jgi:hypothetical protein
MPNYYALMRAGYVLHSLECLQRRVMGKCCSNVLHSLRAYGVTCKAVRTCVCENSDTAYMRSSRCTIPYTQPRARSYTPMHTCMPTYQIQTRMHTLHVYLPIFITAHNSAMYCTHLSVRSVELWASAAAMCCAPSAPMELHARLYAHVCVRTTIQRTCVAHDARSHTYNRERGHIHPCIRACRHTKYKHACIPCTYIYLSSLQRTTQLCTALT